MRLRASIAVVAVGLLACACQVTPGAPPDAGPCAPSTAFFVTDVWLRYLDANQCATAGCHQFADGHGYLRFRPPGNPPDPLASLADWPEAWRDNYQAAVQLVRCDAPLDSRLLSVPEGRADPHPPGVSVEDSASADQLFMDWAGLP